MKTVKSIVIATSIILTSASAVANAAQYSGSNSQASMDTVILNAAPTKQAAYQLGLTKLAQLQTLSPQKLSLELHVHGDVEGNTLHLNGGSYITVQERMDTAGSIGYIGIVNVGYHYLKRNNDSDNN